MNLIALLLVFVGQPAGDPAHEGGPVTPVVRLESLSPDRPLAYLELAEDLLAQPEFSPDDSGLVVQLLARAATLTFETDPIAAASACIALTDRRLAIDADERAWLRMVARSIEPKLEQPSWITQIAEPANAGAIASPLAAAALARLRNGDPRRAALVLDEPGVIDALSASSELRAIRGSQSVEAFFESYADQWPCPVCRGNRLASTNQGNESGHTLCSHCSGDPGPRFETNELILMLRAERSLMGSSRHSWSASSGGVMSGPRRPPVPSELSNRIGVSTENLWWRDGQWVRAITPD